MRQPLFFISSLLFAMNYDYLFLLLGCPCKDVPSKLHMHRWSACALRFDCEIDECHFLRTRNAMKGSDSEVSLILNIDIHV